MFQLLVQTD